MEVPLIPGDSFSFTRKSAHHNQRMTQQSMEQHAAQPVCMK